MYDILGEDVAFVDGDELDGDDMDGVADLVGMTAGDDDLLGDDILGDDILGDDIIGALSRKQKIALAAAGVGTAGLGLIAYKMYQRKKRARQALAGRAIMAKRVKNSPVLAVRKPSRGREQPLNFFQAAVAGGGVSTNVTTRPQTLFRGGRVVLPELANQGGVFIANPFVIFDIIVGRNSQFVARQQMAAAVFFQGAFGVRVQCDTSQVSQDITFVVGNRDADPADFEATIVGESIE